MVDFNDNYINSAKITKISNEASAWNKKIQKPQLHGGVYHFKCNCDLTNGLQDDCRNPNCRSSYTKLTKRTCSCGRSLLKDRFEGTSKEEKKKDVGDGDGGSAEVKESDKSKQKEVKEVNVLIDKQSEKSKEKEVKEVEVKKSQEKVIKEAKVKKSKESEDKENKKPVEKELTESKKVKGKENKEITRKKITRRI